MTVEDLPVSQNTIDLPVSSGDIKIAKNNWMDIPVTSDAPSSCSDPISLPAIVDAEPAGLHGDVDEIPFTSDPMSIVLDPTSQPIDTTKVAIELSDDHSMIPCSTSYPQQAPLVNDTGSVVDPAPGSIPDVPVTAPFYPTAIDLPVSEVHFESIVSPQTDIPTTKGAPHRGDASGTANLIDVPIFRFAITCHTGESHRDRNR